MRYLNIYTLSVPKCKMFYLCYMSNLLKFGQVFKQSINIYNFKIISLLNSSAGVSIIKFIMIYVFIVYLLDKEDISTFFSKFD